MTLPRATYRLQLRNGMSFDWAAELAPYLAQLGIRHIDGGATIDQELVAKAKVMPLHAAAAQIREVVASEAEPAVEAEFGNAAVDDFPTLENEGNSLQDPGEASPSDETEAGVEPRLNRTNHGPLG